jgi:anti-anti-sigma factor
MTALTATAAAAPAGPVLTLAGEATITYVNRLRAAIGAQIDAGTRLLTLDVAGLEFLDAACLRVVLRAAEALADRHGRLTVARPNTLVAAVLTVTGAARLLDVQAGLE